MDQYLNGRKVVKAPEGFTHAFKAHSYSGKTYEYIAVAAKKLGRDIKAEEVVHHIDCDKTNNAPDNLIVLCSTRVHTILHRNGCNLELLKQLDDGSYDINHDIYDPIVYAREHRVCSICGNPIHKDTHGTRCKLCANMMSRKVDRPSKEELKEFVWSEPTAALSKRLGVSDKAIEKWCKLYGIAKPPRGYWAKKRAGKLDAAIV